MATTRSSTSGSSATATLPEPPLMKEPAPKDPKDPSGNDPSAAPAAALPAQQAVTNLGSLIDPDGVLGTRFSGPIMSGPPEAGVAGICTLHKRFKVTAQTGAFTGVPITFPASTILMVLVTQLQQTFNGLTPHLNLGTTPGGTDIASIDLSVAPTQLSQNLATILPSNWTIYASLAITGATTQGKATMLITYSVPAKTLPN